MIFKGDIYEKKQEKNNNNFFYYFKYNFNRSKCICSFWKNRFKWRTQRQQNKSGLGSYHYHCGGHPAHLHTNGVCPYDASSSSIGNSASSSSESSTKTTSTIPTTINVENNSTVKPSIIDQNNIISNTTSSEENNSSLGGILALELLGGGYLGYKKFKK